MRARADLYTVRMLSHLFLFTVINSSLYFYFYPLASELSMCNLRSSSPTTTTTIWYKTIGAHTLAFEGGPATRHPLLQGGDTGIPPGPGALRPIPIFLSHPSAPFSFYMKHWTLAAHTLSLCTLALCEVGGRRRATDEKFYFHDYDYNDYVIDQN